VSDVFRIGVVLSPRGWSGRLRAYVTDHVADIDVVMVRDRRAAAECAAHVILVDDSTPWLTAAFIAEAETHGIRFVGVYDRSDGGRGRSQLAALGLTHLLEESTAPEDVVFLVERLRPARSVAASAPAGGRHDGPEARIGKAVAVGGPSGSGARELALALCSAWAAHAHSTLLIDANETTPGVARRLELGVYPHLLTALDRCRSDGIDGVTATLADQVGRLPFDVIVGSPAPHEWDRIVGHEVDELVATCRRRWQRVVMTTSPLIENLVRWGERFGTSRRALAGADAVVGSVEPTPRGLLRFLDWLTDLSELRGDVVTVVNQLPMSPRVGAEAVGVLSDAGGSMIESILSVPFDRAVRAAERDGVVVRRGRYVKAVARVAAAVDERLDRSRQPVAS
jgi:hypothetical protein